MRNLLTTLFTLANTISKNTQLYGSAPSSSALQGGTRGLPQTVGGDNYIKKLRLRANDVAPLAIAPLTKFPFGFPAYNTWDTVASLAYMEGLLIQLWVNAGITTIEEAIAYTDPAFRNAMDAVHDSSPTSVARQKFENAFTGFFKGKNAATAIGALNAANANMTKWIKADEAEINQLKNSSITTNNRISADEAEIDQLKNSSITTNNRISADEAEINQLKNSSITTNNRISADEAEIGQLTNQQQEQNLINQKIGGNFTRLFNETAALESVTEALKRNVVGLQGQVGALPTFANVTKMLKSELDTRGIPNNSTISLIANAIVTKQAGLQNVTDTEQNYQIALRPTEGDVKTIIKASLAEFLAKGNNTLSEEAYRAGVDTRITALDSELLTKVNATQVTAILNDFYAALPALATVDYVDTVNAIQDSDINTLKNNAAVLKNKTDSLELKVDGLPTLEDFAIFLDEFVSQGANNVSDPIFISAVYTRFKNVFTRIDNLDNSTAAIDKKIDNIEQNITDIKANIKSGTVTREEFEILNATCYRLLNETRGSTDVNTIIKLGQLEKTVNGLAEYMQASVQALIKQLYGTEVPESVKIYAQRAYEAFNRGNNLRGKLASTSNSDTSTKDLGDVGNNTHHANVNSIVFGTMSGMAICAAMYLAWQKCKKPEVAPVKEQTKSSSEESRSRTPIEDPRVDRTITPSAPSTADHTTAREGKTSGEQKNTSDENVTMTSIPRQREVPGTEEMVRPKSSGNNNGTQEEVMRPRSSGNNNGRSDSLNTAVIQSREAVQQIINQGGAPKASNSPEQPSSAHRRSMSQDTKPRPQGNPESHKSTADEILGTIDQLNRRLHCAIQNNQHQGTNLAYVDTYSTINYNFCKSTSGFEKFSKFFDPKNKDFNPSWISDYLMDKTIDEDTRVQRLEEMIDLIDAIAKNLGLNISWGNPEAPGSDMKDVISTGNAIPLEPTVVSDIKNNMGGDKNRNSPSNNNDSSMRVPDDFLHTTKQAALLLNKSSVIKISGRNTPSGLDNYTDAVDANSNIKLDKKPSESEFELLSLLQPQKKPTSSNSLNNNLNQTSSDRKSPLTRINQGGPGRLSPSTMLNQSGRSDLTSSAWFTPRSASQSPVDLKNVGMHPGNISPNRAQSNNVATQAKNISGKAAPSPAKVPGGRLSGTFRNKLESGNTNPLGTVATGVGIFDPNEESERFRQQALTEQQEKRDREAHKEAYNYGIATDITSHVTKLRKAEERQIADTPVNPEGKRTGANSAALQKLRERKTGTRTGTLNLVGANLKGLNFGT